MSFRKVYFLSWIKPALSVYSRSECQYKYNKTLYYASFNLQKVNWLKQVKGRRLLACNDCYTSLGAGLSRPPVQCVKLAWEIIIIILSNSYNSELKLILLSMILLLRGNAYYRVHQKILLVFKSLRSYNYYSELCNLLVTRWKQTEKKRTFQSNLTYYNKHIMQQVEFHNY